jgi:ectoine hydroxylase-related dioxygenase (phytanoyl-CoA dioxygenase family)
VTVPVCDDFDQDGYTLVRSVLSLAEISHLTAAISAADPGEAALRRGGSVYGMRHVARLVPAVAELVHNPVIRRLVEAVLGPEPALVRSLLFDKTPDANWNVAWHQDLTVAMREKVDCPGFTAWSVKAGVPHCQPPDEVLARMVALRLHLDPCAADNGALRVLPGSHRDGRLSDEAIDGWRATTPEVTCAADAGDVLLMRPLLLHASSASRVPGHRRVLQLEFAAAEPLPGGLRWYGG